MMPRDLIAELAARFAAAGIEHARAEAWLLLAAATGRARAELIAGAPATLDPGQETRLEELVRRRLAREPIAYILGEKEFWSLTLEVAPGVLIPRPETETVVEATLLAIGERTSALLMCSCASAGERVFSKYMRLAKTDIPSTSQASAA